jgi:hypothetical protein
MEKYKMFQTTNQSLMIDDHPPIEHGTCGLG